MIKKAACAANAPILSADNLLKIKEYLPKIQFKNILKYTNLDFF